MKKKGTFIFVILVGCVLMTTTQALGASYAELAQKIDAAFFDATPYPYASQEIEGLTVDQAYEIQVEITRLRAAKGDMVMGYKNGLSSAKVQKRFGVPGPIVAPLYKSTFRWPGVLYMKNFVKMFVEPEIGYRFGKNITTPIEDIESLKKAVDIVFPAVEVPDIGFTDLKQATGTDIIAINSAAKKILVGKAVRVRAFDLDAVAVKLFHNGQEITSGVGSNAPGGQWEALKWNVNEALAKGGKIKAGDVCITGILVKLLPGKPGTYRADYGDFGSIEFEVK